MRRLATFAIAAFVTPLSVNAQPAVERARHQTDCRTAVQIVAGGEPREREEWAFSKIRTCGADAGQTIAAMLPRLRHVSDTARLARYFDLTREVYDGRIFRAAMEIANDRSASTPARVFALRSLIWSGNPGRLLSYSDLAGDAGKVSLCAGGFTTHVSLSAGVPLPAGYDAQVRTIAARIAKDGSEPTQVRQAARCAASTRASVWIQEWLKPGEQAPLPRRGTPPRSAP